MVYLLSFLANILGNILSSAKATQLLGFTKAPHIQIPPTETNVPKVTNPAPIFPKHILAASATGVDVLDNESPSIPTHTT